MNTQEDATRRIKEIEREMMKSLVLLLVVIIGVVIVFMWMCQLNMAMVESKASDILYAETKGAMTIYYNVTPDEYVHHITTLKSTPPMKPVFIVKRVFSGGPPRYRILYYDEGDEGARRLYELYTDYNNDTYLLWLAIGITFVMGIIGMILTVLVTHLKVKKLKKSMKEE